MTQTGAYTLWHTPCDWMQTFMRLIILFISIFTLYLPTSLFALGQELDQVGIAFLDLGQTATERPRSAEQLMWEVSKRTSILVREKAYVLNLEKDELFDHPVIVWLGKGEVPKLSKQAILKLNTYLRAGGLLLIDDISPMGDDRFDQGIRQLLLEIWPEDRLKKLKNDDTEKHTIFKSFFLLDRAYGRIQRSSELEGIDLGDFTPIIYSRNDLFGAFGRSMTGEWLMSVTPGGVLQREWAFRLGVNLIMYATCLNYKQDQIHTLTLLRRRKWRATP